MLNLPQKDGKRVQRVTSKFYSGMIKGVDKQIEDVNESHEYTRYLSGLNRPWISFIILKDETTMFRLIFLKQLLFNN